MSESDIDKAVKEAEQHAAEDKSHIRSKPPQTVPLSGRTVPKAEQVEGVLITDDEKAKAEGAT